MKKQRLLALALAGSCLLSLLSGCAASSDDERQDTAAPELDEEQIFVDDFVMEGIEDILDLYQDIDLEDEMLPMSESPVSDRLMPVASGTAVKSGGGAEIDYSNVKDGYVMVKCSSTKKLKVRVFGPSYEKNGTVYTYDLPSNTWTTFPLSDGNGSYKVTALQNTTGKKYSILASASFNVTLTDEFAPFLRPNQYVNYENATKSLAKAAELTEGVDDPLKMVEKIYDYVVNNLTYDKEKAKTVQSGYLPVLDDTLSSGKGICFDYAALMTGMLRSQGVPCKLVIGYAGTQYHAWVSVWTEETGWVEGAVYFDGVSWQRMDPTFISSGKNSEAARKYVGDGKNYNAMYLY